MQVEMVKMVPEPAERPDLTRPVPYATYQRHTNRYIFASKFVRDKSVLDVGCGAGIGDRYWLTKGARRIVGVDISQDAIRSAKAWNVKSNKAEFAFADAQALPFRSNSFDVVISLEAIEHLKEPDRLIAECKRVIKKGGSFICSTPNKKITTPFFKRPANPYHLKEYYPKEFVTLVSGYFAEVTAYGQCLLGLKARIKIGLLTVTRLLLNRVPGGDRLRKFLRKLGKPWLMTPHLPGFSGDFNEMVDEFYDVVPLKDGLFTTPETLIVVARAEDK